MKKEEAIIQIDNQNTIYEVIEQKVKELRKREITEEDIMTIVSTDIESDLISVKQQIGTSDLSRNVLKKLVEPRLIDYVDDFLKEASKKFNKVYSISTFYGICFHLSACLKRNTFAKNLSNEKIMEIIEKYKEEYSFSMNFASRIERNFDVKLPIDEVIFITIFLCENQIQKKDNRPSILVVMHGTIASSIANTVNRIYRDQKVFSYDLLLDKDMNEAYEELKKLCKVIDNGTGVLIIYDMGSVRAMCETIIQETGINARMIEVPITVMILDCTIKLSTTESLDSVYEDIMQSGFGSFGILKDEYQRLSRENNKVIITLCRTGEGSAAQIKQYLEKNIELVDVEIVAFAIDNKKRLVNEINKLKEEHKVLCIVGAYNPELYDIPFISIAKLFDTPVDKLPMILALKDIELSNTFDYSEMYAYLDEQLPAVDILKLKRHLPRVLQKIKKCVKDFTINEEVRLFMHIACSINRIKMNESLPVNFYKSSVIKKQKRLYYELKDILSPLEKTMMVEFNDDELATIIEILT
ncbi:MAG: PRD domain-containing protein [Clostridium sp.]|nr:PRD domain-containing protein [Clostridium sp.]